MANTKYRVLVGLNYGPDGSIRREPGEIADDIPERSVPWLLEQNCIELASKKPADEPKEGEDQ